LGSDLARSAQPYGALYTLGREIAHSQAVGNSIFCRARAGGLAFQPVKNLPLRVGRIDIGRSPSPAHGVSDRRALRKRDAAQQLHDRDMHYVAIRRRGGRPGSWAATFGEVIESVESSPDDNRLKPRSGFSKLVNLLELQQMIRSFTDVQTAEMLTVSSPVTEAASRSSSPVRFL
jgi:hypothetical protein